MEDKKNIQWPGWETVRLIGRGSYGAVYEIRRELYGNVEKAALKHIRIPQNSSDIKELYNDGYDEESITATFESHLKNIISEYSLMRKLNGSANVVNCDDVRVEEDRNEIGWDIYIKMELLTPMTDQLPKQIPEETVIKLGRDLCSALVLCRKHSIVHRDIKPQNIFVSDDGDYKLGDFGIAKTMEKTMGGTKTGTYKYMAPEVYNNQSYGHQADIYSLGLVLYWLLNKKRMPFMPLPPQKLTAGMDEQARNRRLAGEQLPPPADGSEALKRIVLKACAYDPKNRYHTAEEMLADLNALEDERSRPAVRLTSPAQDSQPIPQPATLADEEGTVGAFGRSSATAGASIARPTGPLDEDEATVGAFGAAAHNASANPEAAQKPAPGSPEPKPLAAEPKAAHAIDSAKIADATVLKTKKKSRTPLIAAIAAVLAIVIGLVIWKPWASNEDQSQSDDNLYSSATEEKLDIEGTTKPTIQPTIDVTVPTDVLLNISIFTMPSQTEYFVGDTLDTTGLQLRTNNSSGTSETISGGFSCSPMTLDSSGTQTITVSYGGKTTTFSVFVNPKPEALSETQQETVQENNPGNLLAPIIQVSDTYGNITALRSDGTVVSASNNDAGLKNVVNWHDIVAVSSGYYHTVGLCSDGTVVAVGNNDAGQCNVSDWHDIIAISAGWGVTVGLHSDGTVVATGRNYENQCDVAGWKNIIQVSAGGGHVVGLQADGTVVATGVYSERLNVSTWNNIIAISAGEAHTVGLRSDGTVVAVGWNDYGQCNVEDWSNIIAISAGYFNTVGLRSDGTVVAVGLNDYGQCNVQDWSNIVAVSSGANHTSGVTADGTVLEAGPSENLSRWYP